MSRILRHSPSNTLIIRRGGFIDRPAIFDGNLIAGPSVNFWGPLCVSGSLTLGRGTSVNGEVYARDAVIGAGCVIGGSMKTTGDLTVLDGARIEGGINCGGNLILRPGVATPSAFADGIIEVMGAIDAGEVRAGKKVIARREP